MQACKNSKSLFKFEFAMCGITGKIYFNGDFVLENDIEKMNQAIIHRGPDDGGVYISADKKVGLGHRRLSIIDLSPLGHQPMSYLERYQIVFNGEIYNFQEKREMLEKDGYVFKSKSDTEVILALYAKFGKECLQHLRGMFAFAIYDQQEQTVFCVRDRIGKKPFKYYLDENVFMFASELKAILTQAEYKKEPDYLAIHHFLTLQYCPAPLTGFKGIKKLEPAHWLLVDLKTKQTEKQCYWKLDYSQKLQLSENQWKKRIMEKLEESIKLRMISDVPIGAFLSGGIDSSAVVALMTKLSKEPVKTFTIGFEEEKYNELEYAKQIANQFKTQHTEFVVKSQAVKILPLLARHFEEPYSDKSALPTYYVSRETHDFVTVALNGDGGDENFAGYQRHSIQKFALWYEKFSLIHKIIILPLARLAALLFKNTFFQRVKWFAKTMADKYNYRYANYICIFSNEAKNKIYNDEFRQKISEINSYGIIAEQFKHSGSKDKLDQTLFADFMTYLPDDLMAKTDIDTMAVSLESRSPFLDHEFLELTAKIPNKFKIKGLSNKKYILKKALEDLIPKNILYRKKMGFGVPIESWLRGELKDYAYKLLLSDKANSRNIFKKEEVERLLDEHCNTKISHAQKLWSLIMLEHWFIAFFD